MPCLCGFVARKQKNGNRHMKKSRPKRGPSVRPVFVGVAGRWLLPEIGSGQQPCKPYGTRGTERFEKS